MPYGKGTVGLEALNVGWLTYQDTALETSADFLTVSEHRLIPARVRPVCDGKVFILCGPRLPRKGRMLGLLGLVLG